MPKGSLFQSSRYKSFISDRDRALEQVHLNTRIDISRMLHDALDLIEGYIAKLAIHNKLELNNLRVLSDGFDSYLGNIFWSLLPVLQARVKQMRAATFTLTYTSELEAIGRATSKVKTITLGDFKSKLTQAIHAKTILDEPLENRLWLDLMNLRSRILREFTLALVQELPSSEILAKVKKAFPKIVSYKRPPRLLKPIKEAKKDPLDKDPKELFDFDFMDQGDWDLAVQAYKDTQLPPSRFDNEPEIDPDTKIATYSWEMENDLMDDFVKQVRDGQVAAATELGIKEFIWVAILDDRTDECCRMRSGHTTSEIEEMMADGKLDTDLCDLSVPPGHMNCRCQLAPVASTDEVEGPDWKSFNDWVNS